MDKDLKNINPEAKFEDIPKDDLPSDFDESYLDNVIETKSGKEKEDVKREQI